MTECPVLEDARSHHFDEDDPNAFLFNKPEVALSYLRDAGLTEAGRVWLLIERQKKIEKMLAHYKLTLADSLSTSIAGSLPCLPEAFFAELIRCDSDEATSFAALISITCI